jgi:hypothetical protein
VRKIEENNYFKEKLTKLNKVLMRKKAEGVDTLHWIDYAFEVGVDHLKPLAFEDQGYLFTSDLDVHFILIVTLVVSLIISAYVTSRCFKCCCCSKKNNKRKIE